MSFAHERNSGMQGWIACDPPEHTGYDSGGNLVSVTDPLSRVTTTSYDALNRPTVVTDPMGYATTTTYDANGQVTSVTDPMGRVTTYAYSARGEVPAITDPIGHTTSYSYGAVPDLLKQQIIPGTSGGTLGYTYTYDQDNRVISAMDPLSEVTTTNYDAAGIVKSVVDPNGNTTSYTYNAREWLTTVENAALGVTTFAYNNAGEQTSVTDPNGNVTTTTYDHVGRVQSVTDGNGHTTTYGYNAIGEMTTLTDPDGNVTTWTYDHAGRVINEANPLGTRTYVYDSGGELVKYTDRDGRTTSYSYNADGLQTAEEWLTSSGGNLETITTTYDHDGEITQITDPSSTLSWGYDSGGRVTTISNSGTTGQPTVTLTYGYSPNNQVTSLSDSYATGDSISYGYDGALRLTSISQAIGSGGSGPSVTMSYDSGGRLTGQTRSVSGGNEVVSTISYDHANRIVSIVHSQYIPGGSGGGSTTTLASYSYGYDSGGRLTSQTNNDGSFTYTYDHADQLTAVGGTWAESYSFDSNGNRTMTGYTTGSDNELTNDGTYTYTYDAEGNMTGKSDAAGDTWTYTYDYHNQMSGFTEKNSGGTTIAQGTYVYDVLDRRIETVETVSGVTTTTWTVYNGSSNMPFMDFNGSGTLLTRYLSGPSYIAGVDALLARTSASGTTAWYLDDMLGSVRDIANASGTVIDHIVYDAFGDIRSESSPSNGDRFKFDGMAWDAALASYYDNARYYSAGDGRFSSQDPAGLAAGSMDLFGFVSNAPLGAVDPSGLQSTSGGMMPYMQQQMERQQGMYSQSGGAYSIYNMLPSGDAALNFGANMLYGYTDTMSLGMTEEYRNQNGYQDVANKEALSYKIGYALATVQQIIMMRAASKLICTIVRQSAVLRAAAEAARIYAAATAVSRAGEHAMDSLNSAYQAAQSGDLSGMMWHSYDAGMYIATAIAGVEAMNDSCFAAGTPIITPDGSRPIEEIKPGDIVLSAPEVDATAEPVWRRVQEVYQKYAPLFSVGVQGREIHTTHRHPFWVRGRGWVAAEELKLGDQLRGHEGRWHAIGSTRADLGAAPVYNLRVEADHTYFVGSALWGFSVWAHNDNVCLFKAPRPGTGEDLLQYGLSSEQYPDGASFTPDEGLAEQYAHQYGEGIIKVDIPEDEYNSSYKSLEEPYISDPTCTEVKVPPELYPDFNAYPRSHRNYPWGTGYENPG